MDILKKIEILSGAAKYDVSCSSSGSDRPNVNGGIGNGAKAGICHSWSDDGRCISLLKILFTNFCIYDCAYCINRKSNDIERTGFTVDEIVNLTINFYKRNYIEGLFLSSGIIKSPDFTMEKLITVAKKLRTEQNFNGYIHLKAIPGASIELIKSAGFYVDRLSVNIEIPSDNGLKLLAPDKKKDDILKPMSFIGQNILLNKEERKENRKINSFVGAGQSTQLIVGASPDSDYDIMFLSNNLYKKFNMKRVYYSAYVPIVNNDKRLPVILKPPLKREHRLYQADWLLRFYKFNVEEIIDKNNPFFDDDLDPKFYWALKNLHFFPVEINKADYNTLLRVPGIGVKSAQRIISSRKFNFLRFEDLKKIGIVLKRAKYFITCNGKLFDRLDLNEVKIKNSFLLEDKSNEQLFLF
ncbi:MAG TPA: putative DNA modification/repair radical SAM protein [Spirochaetota bacterium]|nr:putative DNA modification/repair radical SAM protein [Spirochaetota bacterium]